MPIDGMGEGLGFPKIGVIRKGMKLKTNKPDGSTVERPVDLEYFRVEFNKGEDDSRSTFVNLYELQPDEINVLLPLRMEDTWSYWLEAYSRGRQIAKSDGKIYLYRRNKNMDVIVRDGKLVYPDQHTEEEVLQYKGVRGKEDYVNGVQLKPVGRLKVVVPELMRRAYLELKTTSYNDIDNLTRQVRSVYHMEELMGGIPLVLRRKPYKINVPGVGRVESYLITLEPKQEWVKWKMLADANYVLQTWGLDSGRIVPSLKLDGGVIEGEFTNVNTDRDGIPDAKETGEV